MNISLLSRATDGSNNFFDMSTYTGIEVGESWSWVLPPAVSTDPVVGQANISIANLPSVESYNVTFSKEWQGRVNPPSTVTDNGATSDVDFLLQISQSQVDVLISVNP